MRKIHGKPILASVCLALALTACSSDENTVVLDGTTKIKAQFSEATEASWDHTLLLFKGAELVEKKTGKDATFSVEAGAAYSLRAYVVSDLSNVITPTAEDKQILVKDLTKAIPEILTGSSEEKVVSASTSLAVTVKRIVSKAVFEVTAPESVTGISVKIADLNDQMTTRGEVSASAAGLFTTLNLVKSAGKFIGSAILFPSAAERFNLEYTLSFATGDPVKVASTPATHQGGAILVANKETTLKTVITETGAVIDVTADITYEPWGSSIEVNDAIELQPQPIYELRVLTFEDADYKGSGNYLGNSDWSSLVDTPQYGGPLLYGTTGMGPTEYNWFDENNTFLAHQFPENYGTTCYWGGGHAISNYVDTDLANGTFQYQLSVSCKDPQTGKGGHNGSTNFCVHFGYIDGSIYNKTEGLPAIYFADGVARVIDHMYITSNTYLLNCMTNGNGLTAPVGPEDWVRVAATGVDIDGNETGRCSIYLANEGGFVSSWTKWDLTPLGKPLMVYFNIGGSNDNGYGFSQPAYFAYDDVAVQFEK